MKTLSMLCLAAAVAIPLCVPAITRAETVVVDFEQDFGQNQISDGYGGIASWGGTGDPDAYWISLPGDAIWPVHGTRGAYSFHGLGIPIVFGQEYIFNGAWFGGPAMPFETVYFELYLNGTLVHTSAAYTVGTAMTVWCPSGYDQPVDMVRVWQNAGNPSFLMDDFTYTTTGVAAESTTLSAIKALFD